MTRQPYKIKEFGSAKIKITLSEGLITVFNGNGSPLFEKVADCGDWEKIWKAIDPHREEYLQCKYEIKNDI